MATWKCDACGKVEPWDESWGTWGTVDEAAFVCCSDKCAEIVRPFFSRVEKRRLRPSGGGLEYSSVVAARMKLSIHTGIAIAERPVPITGLQSR